MREVTRIDRGTVANVSRQDGILRLEANLTRVGIFKYLNPDGSYRREYRPASEVFKQASLATYSGRPLTVGHRLDAVNAVTWREVAVGDVRDDAHVVGDFVRATVQISDGSTVNRVDAHELVDVSCGYRCDVEDQAGTWNGEPYDCIQRNIRLNHVALLPPGSGRAGAEVRLILDSNQDSCIECESNTNRGDMSDEVTKAKQELEVLELKKQLEQAKGEAAAKAAMLEQARNDAKQAQADLPAKVAARVQLEAEAKRVMPEIKCDGKTDADVQREVVAKLSPSLRVDSDDALRGAFMALVGSWDGGRKDVEKAITSATNEVKTDAAPENMVAEARARNYARSKAMFGLSTKDIQKVEQKLQMKKLEKAAGLK